MNARIELLRRRLDQNGSRRVTIPSRPNKDVAPLSAAQHRMWLHQQLNPKSSAYNVCIQIDFTGNLDEDQLLTALNMVVDRHEVLRTTYLTGTDGQPYQRIHSSLPLSIQIIENNDPTVIAQGVALEPFDLASSGPIRVHLIKISKAHWSLIVTVHHIVWDGGCFGVFSQDLSLAYNGRALSPLLIHYADLAVHQIQLDLNSSTYLDMQMDYWRKILNPLPPALRLPTIRSQGPDVSERANRLDRVMSPFCAIHLRSIASTLKTTPFAIFIATYALLLHRWTGASDITIGTMVANRHQPGSRELLGNFGNTVLLRLHLSGNLTFHQFVTQTTQMITGALSNSDISFERIIADLAPPRESGHGFFTDTLGLFLDRDINGPDLSGIEVQWSNIFNGSSPFALTFQGFLTGDILKVEATFRSELFSQSTVHAMLEHLETILVAVTTNPEQLCSVASQLPINQHDSLIQLSGGENINRPTDSVLNHWRKLVFIMPDQIALIHGLNRFSYAKIDENANQIAARLIENGVHAQDIVAVVIGRGVTTIPVLLGIWKCGAVYLPLDPNYPKARLTSLISKANAKLAICDSGIDIKNIPYLTVSELIQTGHVVSSDFGYEPHALEAAHISFTSGSTGYPKGVVTTHGSLTARTSWVATLWPGGKGRARLAKSAFTAIDATAEICEAIVTGECLVLASDEEARDATALARLLATHNIGHFMAVPGLLEAVTIANPEVVASRDRVISTGEPLLPSVACSIYDKVPFVALYNSYGCTETTGDVIFGQVDKAEIQKGRMSIGKPLPGSGCYILAEDLTFAPPGVIGELYIAGDQLVRGYLLQPALTAARFIANPFGIGGRLYRTGDLARWRVDGQLELAGRSDDQVNVRGHRVEPAETVEALHAIENIREAAVIPRAVRSTTELVAYVAGDGLKPEDGVAIRESLARTLPGPLVPTEIIILSYLPRLDGGKIDRQALPRNVAMVPPLSSRAPRNESERILANFLSDLLGCKSVGIDDNFFELGGDSLLAVSFAARANAAELKFPAALVFQYPTIAQLAQHLSPPTKEPNKSLPLPVPMHRFRLSGLPVQDFITWEILHGSVERDRLEQILSETVSRYPFLRQSIVIRGRLWRAIQLQKSDNEVKVIEINQSNIIEAVETARSAIDLSKGRVIVALISADWAVLVAHPVVIDGVSLARIASEIDAQLKAEQFDNSGQWRPFSKLLASSSSTVDASYWDSIVHMGPGSPWWIDPNDSLPVGRSSRARTTINPVFEVKIIKTILHVIRVFSGMEMVIVDVEVNPETIGPLFAVPVVVRGSAEVAIGDANSYTAYLSTHRPIAGGAGVLVRRTVTPEHWQADGIARGVDRLYHIVVSWQELNHQIVLEVSADDGDIAEKLLNAWVTALSDQDYVNE